MLFHKHEIEYLATDDPAPIMFHHTNLDGKEVNEYIYPQIKGSIFSFVTDNPDPVLHDPHFAVETHRKVRYCYTFS